MDMLAHPRSKQFFSLISKWVLLVLMNLSIQCWSHFKTWGVASFFRVAAVILKVTLLLKNIFSVMLSQALSSLLSFSSPQNNKNNANSMNVSFVPFIYKLCLVSYVLCLVFCVFLFPYFSCFCWSNFHKCQNIFHAFWPENSFWHLQKLLQQKQKKKVNKKT